jgi:predicted ATP-grasp superfamily ATP-dependent carboligase
MSAPPIGALVIGGDYRALGAVRSLGRQGVPVDVLYDREHPLAPASRFARRRIAWPADDRRRLALLLRLADRGGMFGAVLIPSSDEVAAFIGRHHAELAARYRLTTPDWDRLQWAHDKRRLHELADRVGVAHPWTAYPTAGDDVPRLVRDFPMVLKPVSHEAPNPLARDKAWRVDDARALADRYAEALAFLRPEQVMLQELIPGGGEAQYSYGAVVERGRPLAEVVARRLRQYPMDFGRLSTFVDTVDEPTVVDASRRLLAAARYTGLIEIEFKRDPRDGRFKVLDANPRIWGWHTLTQRTGPDFVHLLYRMVVGAPVAAAPASPGLRWARLDADLAASAGELLAGRLPPTDYVRSLAGRVEAAIFAADDPLPGAVALGQLQIMALRGAAARLATPLRRALRSASGAADDRSDLLEVHQVMHPGKEQPLPAAQKADQRVVQRTGLRLVSGDRGSRDRHRAA